MKKFCIIAALLLTSYLYGQLPMTTIIEDFDGVVSFFNPTGVWGPDSSYYVGSSDIFGNTPKSYLGEIPNRVGDTAILLTPQYDFSNADYIQLKFSHICKVSPLDIVRIQYKENNTSTWMDIPYWLYDGNASNYRVTGGFNADSYSEWQGNNMYAFPQQSWWKEEIFDLSSDCRRGRFEFRFIIIHGQTQATQVSYGWLLDNVEFTYSTYKINPPIVEFQDPVIKDTAYTTGPFTIQADVQSTSGSSLLPVWLKYIVLQNGVISMDSGVMLRKEGSIYEASIPKYPAGTKVVYSITAKDVIGNHKTVSSGFMIAIPQNGEVHYGVNSIELVSLESPIIGQTVAGISTPVSVTFKNKGTANLISLDFGWSINGQVQTPAPATWTGNLSWDYTISGHTIANYIPSGGYDTIKVWITMPNGQLDSILWDDTLTIITYGCDATMGGVYSVGNNNAHYKSVQDVINVLNLCTPVSDITLNLQSGVYNENWDFTKLSDVMGNFTLKITSLRNHKDSVILQPNSGVVAVLLGKTNNVVFENITIKASENAHAVQFINTCTNIVINNCNILADTTIKQATSYPIYKGSSTGLVSNIQITNNVIEGGYDGVFFYGGIGTSANQFGENVILDSNIIRNPYNNGMNIIYTNLISVSHNTILSRIDNAGISWRGLLMNVSNGAVIGNKIIQRSDSIKQIYGLHLYNYHIYNTQNKGNVVNNEIIVYANTNSGNRYGIYVNYAQALIAHNSVYVRGDSASQGIHIENVSASHLTVRNNNIIMESNNGFPIYLAGITYLSQWNINANNYYAPQYIGYNGVSPVTNLTTWQQRITTDVNSVRITPDFVDGTKTLKWNDYTGLQCSYLRDFNYDINGNYRSSLTSMGCYNGVTPFNGDIEVTQILNFITGGSDPGSTKSISLEIFNAGTTTVTRASFGWKFNNGTLNTATFQGTLAAGEYDTVPLGQITYILGENTLIAYLLNSNLNNGVLTDQYFKNDTAGANIESCHSFNGRQSIGNNNADFETIEDFFARASFCGVNGDIELAYQNGEYAITNIAIGNYVSIMNGYKLTITSLNGDPALVKLKVSSGVAFTLANVRNFVIDAITIDVTSGTYGIQFTNTCTNIIISNCQIDVNPITTSTSYAAIYKSTTGILDNITIINNILDGGNGIYLNAAPNTSAYGTNIRIDSNIIINAYYAIYLQYGNFSSISNNTLFSRTENAGTYWYALRILNSNGFRINGNIIRQQSPISYPSGIYLSDVNIRNFKYPDFPDTLLISNNIVYASMGVSSSSSHALTVVTSRANIINNTFYGVSNGITGGYGAYFTINNDYYLGVKNNIFIQLSSAGYPVYINGSFPGQWDFDANLLYSGGSYVGYSGGTRTTISAWKSSVITDSRSVSLMPDFINVPDNLDLLDVTPINVARHPLVINDIVGIQRGTRTNMGAYHYYDHPNDVQPHAILMQTFYTKGDRVPVNVTIYNQGVNILTSATINWIINGGIVQSKQWTGSLSHGTVSGIINLDTIDITGPIELVVYTTLPNNITDLRTYNDTLHFGIAACDTLLNGNYTVGHGGDFASMDVAWLILYNCGIGGNVNLFVAPGNYQANKTLTKIPGSNATKRVTISSGTGNKEDVIFTGYFTFQDAQYMTLKNITIDNSAVTNQATLLLRGSCTGLEFDGCHILANPVSTASTIAGIHYNGVSGGNDYLRDLSVVNNTIEGGGMNINIDYGGPSTSNRGSITRIDNNQLLNSSNYVIYLHSIEISSISNNVSNTRGNGHYGYMMNYTSIDTISANKTRFDNTGYAYGFYITNSSRALTRNTVYIANNEMYKPTASSGTTSMMYISGVPADILHNTIYMGGTTATVHGINIPSMSGTLNIKNNIIRLSSTGSYPLYLGSNVKPTSIDNNCYFHTSATNGIASIGGTVVTTLAQLRLQTGGDLNSVIQDPILKNINTSLELADTFRLPCPTLSEVSVDINNAPRYGKTTNIGAYTYSPYQLDGALIAANIGHMPSGVLSTPSVVLANVGEDTITSAIVEFSLNGIQASQPITWMGTIPFQGQATIPLSDVTPNYGNNDIKIWLTDINGQGLDVNQDNDTISESYFACRTVFHNTSYTIGTSSQADFKHVDSAIVAIIECGITGNVTLYLESDIFKYNIDFSPLSGLIPDGVTLTLASFSGNASDVVIKPSIGDAILFFENSNIVIKNITIDVSALDASGIVFNAKCSNIDVYGCVILGKMITSSTGYHSGIKYRAGSGHANYLHNINIINNTIDGFYYGIHLYYVTGSSSNMGNSSITIDSNTVTNAYSYGMYLYYYSSYKSISYNTVKSRNKTTSTYYGIYTSSYITVAEMVGNKIFIMGDTNSTINSSVYGIYLNSSYLNYYAAKGPGLVANNEIIIYSTKGTTASTVIPQGIYIGGTNIRWNIINNSIYMHTYNHQCYAMNKYAGATTVYSGDMINVYHNLLVINSNNLSSSPLYIQNPIFIQSTFGLNDYNNYYNMQGNYIAWLGIPYTSIGDIQLLGQDRNSRSYNPFLKNPLVDLGLSSIGFSKLLVQVNALVNNDINGKKRGNNTAIGAYDIIPSSPLSVAIDFTDWEEEVILQSTNNIRVSIINMSSTPITNATIGWSINGQNQTPHSYNPSMALRSLASVNISLGTYQALQSATEIKAWVINVNGGVNELDDTAVVTSNIVPLAEFVAPFHKDTINDLSLNVYAKIRSVTGAPAITPELNLVMTINNAVVIMDTIPMTFVIDEKWVANIPSQYYNTKVVYSLTVEDTLSNIYTVIDSTYIKYTEIYDTIIVGEFEVTSYYSPIYYNGNGWSKQIYLGSEINPHNKDVIITKFAYESTNVSFPYPNQMCYMRLVDDVSYASGAYIDPSTISQLVWSGTYNAVPGWSEIELTTPFNLPPNKNLEVFWVHLAGMGPGTSYTWKHSPTGGAFMAARYGSTSTSYIPGTATLMYERPNARFVVESPKSLYSGYNLAIIEILEPVNNPDVLCYPDYSGVKVVVANLGNEEYNFALSHLNLSVEVTAPIPFSANITIRTGRLAAGEMDTISITNILPIMLSGRYDITMWLTNAADIITYDDTLKYEFISGKLALPVDEQFMNNNDWEISFDDETIEGDNDWKVMIGHSPQDSTIIPVFRNGMLSFIGKRGDLTRLSTRQLDLYGSANPSIQFWYFHDTVLAEAKDYMDVLITFDGGNTETEVMKLVKYNTVRGWHHYTIPLSNYATESCVIITFESMIKSVSGAHYLDRILITSEQDIELSELTLSGYSICDLVHNELTLKRRTTTNQTIDFSLYTSSIQVDITGPTNHSFNYLLTDILMGDTSDIITIAKDINLVPGTYTVIAYLTNPIDENSVNDTVRATIIINPKFEINIQRISDNNNPASGEFINNQIITIENIGNMDLPDIGLILTVTSDKEDGEEYYFTTKKTVDKNLSPGERETIKFDSSYIVPWASVYTVTVQGYLLCDPALVDTTVSVQEKVNIDDLYIVGITQPSSNTIDIVNDFMEVSIEVRNRNIGRVYDEGIKVWLLITDTNGNQRQKIEKELPRIEGVDPVAYTFTEKYKVPELSKYHLTVYIENVDKYAKNDTATMVRQTNHGDVSISNLKGVSFTMEQNIPNPAKNKTIINYSIPRYGEITFQVHNVSGQLLYSQKENVSLGKHQIELNISDYASGIYFYTMEYKGQRIVKRMSIRR